MAGDWEIAYRELKRFIDDTPQILINRDTVAISREFRPHFYNRLNVLSETFLVEELPLLLSRSEQLNGNYHGIKEHICEILRLEDVALPSNFNNFLTNPVIYLMEVLNQQLFNLLRGEMDLDTFIQVMKNQVEGHFAEVYRFGYQVWAALSIISLLAPDKAFQVSAVDLDEDPLLTELDVGGIYEGSVSEPEMARCVSFKHPQLCSFVVPDMIINSARTEKHIAIRTELTEASWRSSSYSDEREWYTLYLPRLDYSSSLPINGIVIYTDWNMGNITLISDFVKVCRPELIVQCLTYQAQQDEEPLGNIIFHHKFLDPKLGTFIITDELVPDWLYEKLDMMLERKEEGERIRFLNVGFDHGNLMPIIDAILSC